MLLETYLEYLRVERNLSPITIEGYRGDLKAFESFYKSIDSELTWQTIDADIAREWMVSMMERGLKPSSVQCRLSALRSCYRFLFQRGYVSQDPVHNLEAPKGERPLPAFVREEDMNRLLDTPGMFEDSFEGRRDKLIVEMFYETGLRLSELAGLDLIDVNLSACSLRVLGKGNKERIVPFGGRLLHLINIYIGERELLAKQGHVLLDANALFVNGRGKRLSRGAIQVMVRRQLGLVTEQKKRSPHVLRHTFATSMLNHQANLESVKELLGHSKLQTTEIYTHVTFEELKKAYSEAHPRA